MSETVLCEKCGEPMTSYKDGSSMGMICKKCGWGWATTEIDELCSDETIYSVRIPCNYSDDKTALSLVAKYTSNNYLGAKKLIESNLVLLEGTAPTIAAFLKQCTNAGITYSVDPHFPYAL